VQVFKRARRLEFLLDSSRQGPIGAALEPLLAPLRRLTRSASRSTAVGAPCFFGDLIATERPVAVSRRKPIIVS